MKRILLILGALILVTAIKAMAWISENGTPASFMPAAPADWVGFCFAVTLVASFLACLIWYFVRGNKNLAEERKQFQSIVGSRSDKQ